MPFYEYRCEDCGERFAALRLIAERDQAIECPRCGKQKTERVLSSFATPREGAARGSTSCAPGFG